MDQRPTGRQRIGGGAGRRRDDQAVGALVGDEMAIDLDPQLDHARRGTPVDHDVVHGERMKNAVAVADHPRLHQAALVFFVRAVQHG